MNIFLIIIGTILIIFSALLLCPITLYIEKLQGKEFKFKVNFLFISFDNKSKVPSSKNTKTGAKPEEEKEKLPFYEKVKYYGMLISDLLEDINALLSHIRIKNLYLKLVVAEGDAAFNAIAFGSVCSVVYPLLGIIENKTKVDKGAFDLDIRCDYNGKKSEYGFFSTLRLTPLMMIIIGIRVYFKLKKR